MPPELVGDVFIDRTGVSLFFGDPELREQLQNGMSFHLQFPG